MEQTKLQASSYDDFDEIARQSVAELKLNNYQKVIVGKAIAELLRTIDAEPVVVEEPDSLTSLLIDCGMVFYQTGQESANWFAKKRMSDLHKAYTASGAKPLPPNWYEGGES